MKIKKTFPILGMSCASCAARVDKVLNNQPGVLEANINYATADAQIVYDTDKCSGLVLKTAVQNAGYDLLIDAGNDTEQEAEQARAAKYRTLKIQTWGAIMLSLPIMIISMFAVDITFMQYVLWILSTIVVLSLIHI